MAHQIKTWGVALLLAALMVGRPSGQPRLAAAAPPARDDPVAQCAQGVELFYAGQDEEALPLLEAGFAGREEATFADPDDLGVCALSLGGLRQNQGERSGALEAYRVAQETFEATGNHKLHGYAWNNIGEVYRLQARYPEALDAYDHSLAQARLARDLHGEGVTLNNMGLVYDHQGDGARALEAYQKSLTIKRRREDREGEATTLNNMAGVYAAQGQYDEALEAFQRALPLMRELGTPAQVATVLSGLGTVYDDLGRYEQALMAYEEALAIQRSLQDVAGMGVTLNNIGALHVAQGRHAEALEAFQAALVTLDTIPNPRLEAHVLGNIGTTYQEQGRYAQALEALDRALAILVEIGDRRGQGRTLNSIGAVQDDQGYRTDALTTYEQALAIRLEVEDRYGEAVTRNNMGRVYDAQGRYADALAAYQRALAIQQELGGPGGQGTILNNIGAIYDVQGRHTEAIETYLAALPFREQANDRFGQAVTLSNLGVAYDAMGEDGEALAYLRQALTIHRDVESAWGVAAALHGIGSVYEDQGRDDEALNAYEEALAIRREIGDRFGQGVTLNNMGALYVAQGRYEQALQVYEEALAASEAVEDQLGVGMTRNNMGWLYEQQGRASTALEQYGQAMDALEAVRAVAGSEAGRAAFIAQYAELYARAVGLQHAQGQDQDAFATSERGRARAFLDSLATGHVELSDDEATGLLTAEQEAYAARQTAQNALTRAGALEPPDPALVADLEAQLADTEAAYTAALDALQARSDQLAALVPGRGTSLSLAALQARLDSQATLISYYVLGEQGSLAFIIGRDSFNTVELREATPDNLRAALVALYRWPSLEEPHPRALRELHTWLLAPLVDQLQTPLVGVVPHQLLHYVPFAALSDGQSYFGQQHMLFALPSASTLPFIQDNAADTAAAGAVVLGDPDTGDPALRRLSYAARSAQAVAQALGTRAYTGSDASEARLRTETARARVVHLAAHGSYNVAAPLYSTIFLAPSEAFDGRLEAHEVYGLDLQASDLVVLSACESLIAELADTQEIAVSAGDELVGLTRAFFFAGAPTVIASLWSVDDAATEELMVAFYRHWQAGKGKAEALQAAQAELQQEYASPYFWAAFVLSGIPSRVEPGGESGSPPSDGATGGLCASLGTGAPLLLFGLWQAGQRRRERQRAEARERTAHIEEARDGSTR
jgi:CHAT domain-containing protein/Tfp pilus assembly protein PilF